MNGFSGRPWTPCCGLLEPITHRDEVTLCGRLARAHDEHMGTCERAQILRPKADRQKGHPR